MLKIRLQRTGRKHEPTFRVVLTDSKNSTKSGKYLERLGSYDARKENEVLNADRIKYWISKGAKPSDTVFNILVQHKVIEGKKKNVLPRKSPIKKEEEPKAETAGAPAESAPANEPVSEGAPAEAVADKEESTPAEASEPTAEAFPDPVPAEEAPVVEEAPSPATPEEESK